MEIKWKLNEDGQDKLNHTMGWGTREEMSND